MLQSKVLQHNHFHDLPSKVSLKIYLLVYIIILSVHGNAISKDPRKKVSLNDFEMSCRQARLATIGT